MPACQAARAATGAIPFVAIVSGDPVATGLAPSIARPGGNLTGITYNATGLTAKRIELLKEMLPGLAAVGMLANPNLCHLPFEADTQVAAERLGIVPVSTL
jgi:putative ABC transport system substrate-binding protein